MSKEKQANLYATDALPVAMGLKRSTTPLVVVVKDGLGGHRADVLPVPGGQDLVQLLQSIRGLSAAKICVSMDAAKGIAEAYNNQFAEADTIAPRKRCRCNRDQLVLDNLDIVTTVVDKLTTNNAGVAIREDLVKEGNLALVEAAVRYVPGPAAFPTYAQAFVAGAVKKALRAVA